MNEDASPLERRRKEDSEIVSGKRLNPRAGMLFTSIVCGAYFLWALFAPFGAETKRVVSDVASPLVALIGTVWGLWGFGARRRAAGKRPDAPTQAVWAAGFVTLAIASYGLGAGVWAFCELILRESPFPSWADASYLLGSVSMIVGIVLLPGQRMPAIVRFRVLLDSLMVMAGLMTFSWYFVLGPTILGADGSGLSKFLGASYPILDLTMVSCVLVVSARTQDKAAVQVRNLLCAGALCYVVADVGFGYLTLQGKYQAGSPLDVGWMIANLLMGKAAFALRQRREVALTPATLEEVAMGRAPALGRMLLPYALVPAVAALLFYVWHTKVVGPLATGVYLGSTVLVTLLLVRQVFSIVDNSRLYRFLHEAYRELEALATFDGMTGLANHRVFQQRLRKEIGAAETKETAVSLLLIDVDRFKAYNDHFGHPAGDEALKIVAGILKENVRATDLAARYGGEEFAIVLADSDLTGACEIGERIRVACESTPFPHRGVTLSIGIATWKGGEPGAMIEEADRALYAAKHSGRNRVAVQSAPLTVWNNPEGPVPMPSGGLSLRETRAHGIDRLTVETQGPAAPLLKAMLAMLSLHDGDVPSRPDRVMRYCLRLAEEAVSRGAIEVSPSEVGDIHLGALLHDIGKVGVPEAILGKPGALSETEWAIVRRHPIQGAELLADFPHLAGAVPIVRSHHERWDGTGYPDGLAGNAIPLGARLFALADTLDAMGSDRPYRAALKYPAIREEIRRMSGTQFDPSLVQAFLNIPQGEWESIRDGQAGQEPERTSREAA